MRLIFITASLVLSLFGSSFGHASETDAVAQKLFEGVRQRPISALSKMLSAAINTQDVSEFKVRFLEWKPSNWSNEPRGVIEVRLHDKGAAETVVIKADIQLLQTWAYVHQFETSTIPDAHPAPGVSVGSN